MPLRNRSLIIVDPCPEDYAPLSRLAQQRGLCVSHYQGGNELLEQGVPASAFCWLINFELPDMSGVELCNVLKARLLRSVVFVVANDYDTGVEIAVLSSGLAQFTCKPLDPFWFRDRVPWHDIRRSARIPSPERKCRSLAPLTVTTEELWRGNGSLT
jgi:FixJ family two-component response regulator